MLSHLVAASVSVDLAERQALLAEPDGRTRLRAELSLLRREAVLLQVLRAAPVAGAAARPDQPQLRARPATPAATGAGAAR